MLNFNMILLTDLSDKIINFKKLLNPKDTIIWKKCNNLKIFVNSKINKFEFNNCNNIKMSILGTISGMEINHCKNITIQLPKNHKITSLHLYKSNIKIIGNKKDFKKIHIMNEESKIDFICV